MKKTDSKNGRTFMKVLLRPFALCVLAMNLTVFTGCTEIVEEVVELPAFPEAQELTYEFMNTTQEFTFEANFPWTLVSPAIWCKFVSEENEETYSVTGTPGKYTIKILVTGEGQTTESKGDKTELRLIMGDQEQTVATVNRLTKGHNFILYDAEGNILPEDQWELEVGYKNPIPFAIRANFPFVVKSSPKWVNIIPPVTGVFGEKVNSALLIKGEARYPLPKAAEEGATTVDPNTVGVIVFSNGKAEEEEKTFEVKVKYAGMPADELIVTDKPASRVDWTLDLEGKTFYQKNTKVGYKVEDVEIHNRLTFGFKALNDDLTPVYFDYKDNKYSIVSESWMTFTADESRKGNFNLAAAASDQERKGAVAVLPAAVYEREKADLAGFFLDGKGAFKFETHSKYVVAEINQVKVETPPMFTVTGLNGNPVEVAKVVDENMLKPWVRAGIPAENVYTVVQTEKYMYVDHFDVGYNQARFYKEDGQTTYPGYGANVVVSGSKVTGKRTKVTFLQTYDPLIGMVIQSKDRTQKAVLLFIPAAE